VTSNYKRGVHCGGETYVRVGEPKDEVLDGDYRQLTPEEIEKLFGFLPGWTDIYWNGSEGAPKTRRYEALGNSMSVPVLRWLGERLEAVDETGFDVFN
jgi:DNA (cytosine-5)-methyltransferase 1